MKMTLAERLKLAMRNANVTQASLAERIGVSQAAIQKLTSGKAKSSTKLVEIARALDVRPEWLSDENGEMKSSNRVSEIPGSYDVVPVDPWDSTTPLRSDEVEVPYYKDIELAAGDGSFAEEDNNGFMLRFSKSTLRKVGADTSGEGVICFPAYGNSMEPIIPSGTTVAVDCYNKKIIDGKLYAINQDGLKRIKQLYRKPGGMVVIRSFNRDEYADEEIPEEKVEVMGRVFWWSVLDV
ncbi:MULTISPECIES: XRE family transcriptional regulator [Erwiniaceae]|uniref:XRE family transcriptional regulator n=1 Tax=[Erwinia] mediterraneensis TaxID=2161819 RepID=UPI00102FB188|nr:helix-turn-helix transcriptional regulator [[Erwinia] mediterraneensis]QNU44358.1 helix-turn-helix transcriptional regulator [Mixta calida]